MDMGRFICSLGPCINRRTFRKHGCLKCEDSGLNDFDQNMRSFRDMNTEEKIEKNLIGSRSCFSTNQNEEGWGKKHQPIMQKNIGHNPNEDAAEQKEEKKWSQVIAKTIGTYNKAAWMITTTSDFSHQSFEKITNPSS